MQPSCIYSFLLFSGIFCMRSPWPPERSAEEDTAPSDCIWAIQVQKERGCATAFCVDEMLALGLRRGNWSPACPGTSWDHGYLDFYRHFPLAPLWISLWKLEWWCNGTLKVFHYCKGVLSVLRTEWVYLFWSVLLVLEELCSGRPSHTIAEGAASLVSPPRCLLGKQHQYTLSTAPLASCAPVWPTFQWLNAKIHGCNIFKGLSHLSHSGCLCWQSLSLFLSCL